MPKFLVHIDAPAIGLTSFRIEATDSDSAIDQAVQEYLVTERGPGRHLAKLRSESLASAKITATEVK